MDGNDGIAHTDANTAIAQCYEALKPEMNLSRDK